MQGIVPAICIGTVIRMYVELYACMYDIDEKIPSR